jgi:hypothetical protein
MHEDQLVETKSSRTKEMYDIVVDYSGYSTLAGLIYVFMPGQPFIGKVKALAITPFVQFFRTKAYDILCHWFLVAEKLILKCW